MLLGNQNVLSRHPGRDIGGGATGLGYDRGAANKSGMSRAVLTNGDWDYLSGRPDGYRPGYAWIIPQRAGGMSARFVLSGTGAYTAAGTRGLNAVAALSGSGTLSATGALIVSAVAALSGSGTLSANLLAVLNAVAALSGSGGLTGATSAYGALISALSGSGTVTGTRYAIGEIAADLTPFTELSPASLAGAVWSAIAVDNNDAGTMGEKLNDAGSASNPWTEVIEGSYTAAELLRIMAAALAGELSGAGTTTVTILGVDGATERIIATVTTDGDRTALTLDGS